MTNPPTHLRAKMQLETRASHRLVFSVVRKILSNFGITFHSFTISRKHAEYASFYEVKIFFLTGESLTLPPSW